MMNEFFDNFLNFANPIIYGAIHGLGIYAGFLLYRRTRNAGPLLLIISNIAQILVSLTFFASNFFSTQFFLNLQMMQMFWLSLTLADLLATGLLLVAIFLIAKDFRSLIDDQKLSSSHP